jgi:hypothetical protein
MNVIEVEEWNEGNLIMKALGVSWLFPFRQKEEFPEGDPVGRAERQRVFFGFSHPPAAPTPKAMACVRGKNAEKRICVKAFVALAGMLQNAQVL